MSRDPDYSPFTGRLSPRIPHEPIWLLEKGDEAIRCDFRTSAAGVEAQFFRNGEFLYGQRFADRAGAEQFAAEKRREVERRGYVEAAP
jgi:hypothetical protein